MRRGRGEERGRKESRYIDRETNYSCQHTNHRWRIYFFRWSKKKKKGGGKTGSKISLHANSINPISRPTRLNFVPALLSILSAPLSIYLSIYLSYPPRARVGFSCSFVRAFSRLDSDIEELQLWIIPLPASRFPELAIEKCHISLKNLRCAWRRLRYHGEWTQVIDIPSWILFEYYSILAPLPCVYPQEENPARFRLIPDR